jgi:hypothetical protein
MQLHITQDMQAAAKEGGATKSPTQPDSLATTVPVAPPQSSPPSPGEQYLGIIQSSLAKQAAEEESEQEVRCAVCALC